MHTSIAALRWGHMSLLDHVTIIGQSYAWMYKHDSSLRGVPLTRESLDLARPTPVMPMANTTASAWCTL